MTGVRNRCVFYVSGFDPKGAAHYHGLYQRESQRQSRLNGWTFHVGSRSRLPGGNAMWMIEARHPVQGHVSTHYEFMRWDDLVRQNWPMQTAVLWLDVIRTTLFNLRHGSLWQMFRLAWPPAMALFAPFVLLLVVLVGAPLSSLALAGWALTALQWPLWAGLGLALLGMVLVGSAGRYLESRLSMYWLMRSYAFTARQALDQVPDLQDRLDEQARRLIERMRECRDDEILMVAHSSGTIMAVSILARASAMLEASGQNELQANARVSFMTLGQCIPLLACLPQAKAFRAELALLGQAPWIDWIDFSAPPDGCCFALADPMPLAGVPSLKSPKLLSPKFAEMFEAARYRILRKDKFQMHFQYLMSHDRAVDYDYFLITAADKTLKDRFAHVPSVTNFVALRPFA